MRTRTIRHARTHRRTEIPMTAPVDLVEDDPHDHDKGLAFDVATLVDRRRALGFLAAGGAAVALAACGSSGSDGSTGTSTTGSSSSSSSDEGAAADGSTAVPEETGGPYPADGTNGPDVLTESGVIRQDITTSFGDLSGTAEGVPMTVDLKLIDVAGGGGALAGGALYLWHCTAEGGYSLYSQGITDQNFLRGVQEADADGTLSFTSIWPGCYDGRWPHIHFEVWSSLDDATSGGQKLRTSQIALPEEVCTQVYGSDDRYSASVSNLSRLSLETDMVFSDGYASQVPTWEGSVDEGFTITLNVGV
jgi:protocatechuate 3,4-dioxygenase beta subunit